MLYLLTDDQGRALLIARSANQAEADSYGRAHLPEFCGTSIPVDERLQPDAEEFWGIRTVTIAGEGAVTVAERKTKKARKPVMGLFTHVWVHGLDMPEGMLDEDLLTPEDRRDIALDHISRTCETVGCIEIHKWA